ncbi:hypothetical protein Bpfe_021794 [Biomphalaria pfeifferi]|uniref:Uncharacterized protein n=1 Tax=Biomphalaria pfeifferi TaxID=112525 RepID=A0AAD8F3C8_BIOPF|nr:hypothetical protein Bpfe_021794 [Biomphalaria pfeifferi]
MSSTRRADVIKKYSGCHQLAGQMSLKLTADVINTPGRCHLNLQRILPICRADVIKTYSGFYQQPGKMSLKITADVINTPGRCH